MIPSRIIFISLLLMLQPSSAIFETQEHSWLESVMKQAKKIPYWQEPAFYLLIAATSTTIGTIWYTVHYLCRFNLSDANSLIVKSQELLTTHKNKYSREINAVNTYQESDQLKKELSSIILDNISPTPFADYVTIAYEDFNECQTYANKIEKGYLKLKKAYLALSQKKVSESKAQDKKLQIEDYTKTLVQLVELKKELEAFVKLLGSLCTFCWQDNRYKDEWLQLKWQEIATR